MGGWGVTTHNSNTAEMFTKSERAPQENATAEKAGHEKM